MTQQFQQCIDYEDYKKLVDKQSHSPRKNIFQENRSLTQQINHLHEANSLLRNKAHHFQNMCYSIIDAIGRVYSRDVAEELEKIMEERNTELEVSKSKINSSVYEIMLTHQSQPTVSDWSQSHHKLTPEKTINLEESWKSNRSKSQSNSPISLSSSSLIANAKPIKQESKSTSRSSHVSIIATGITCQLCEQTFSPNEFVEHANICKEPSFAYTEQQSINLGSHEIFEDTQDLNLKKQSENHNAMMKNLLKIRSQIEEQIKLLRFSKQKIDRDAEKRKLEKELARVLEIICQKKKMKSSSKPSNKCRVSNKSYKNAPLKLKN